MSDEKEKLISRKAELEASIQAICDAIKRPGVSAFDRLAMHMDRKDERQQLADINAKLFEVQS